MSLNCNEINLILSELDLEGAFIQEIIQPGFDTLALYTYKSGTDGTTGETVAPGVTGTNRSKPVLICTAQNSIRMNETRRKITKNEKPLRFMEFLRAHIKGAKINSCKQIGLERIVKLELTRNVTPEAPKKNVAVNSIVLPGMAQAFGKTGALPQALSVKQKQEDETNEIK